MALRSMPDPMPAASVAATVGSRGKPQRARSMSVSMMLVSPAERIASMAAMLFARRYGDEVAKEILFTGAEYSGTDLQRRLGGLRVAEPDQQHVDAIRLATDWSKRTRESLIRWKQSRTQALRAQLDEFAREQVSPQASHDIQSGIAAAVALRSKVVTATLHPEGILCVTLVDRESKNQFSDALVDGMGRDVERGGDFLGRQMLIDQPKAVELACAQPRDAVRDRGVAREAARARRPLPAR